MIEAIADTYPASARQTWLYTRRMFGWALNRDVYGLTASPCDRIRIADLIGSPKARERVLEPDELRAIWQVTAAGKFPFDPFVRLLLLLGCRRGELAGMRRDELDLANGIWQLSGDRTKNEQPRTIPLCRQAVAILASLPAFPARSFSPPQAARGRSSALPGGSSGLIGGLGTAIPTPWTLHDLQANDADASVRAADQRDRRRADDRA